MKKNNKKYDDSFLKDSLKNNDSYNIETTSNDILVKFEKEKELNKDKVSKKKTFPKSLKIAIPTISFAALALLIIVPITLNNIGGGIDPIVPPTPRPSCSIEELPEDYQEVIGKELKTLASFNTLYSLNESTINSFNLLNLNSKNNNLTINNKEEIVNFFDPYAFTTLSLTQNKDEPFEISSTKLEKDEYEYSVTYKSVIDEANITIKYSLYYENDDGEFVLEGVLDNNNLTPITIKKEIEDKNESKIETIIYYSSSSIVLIEEESEINGNESENSFSFSTYTSEVNLRREIYETKFSYEIETEEKEIEMEVEIEDMETSLSLEILKHENKTLYLEYEYEKEKTDLEFEGLLTCVFNELDSQKEYYFDDSLDPIIKKY